MKNNVTCKSDTEITEFLRGKFFLMLFNQMTFDTSEFTEKSIKKVAKVIWLPVNTQIR